MTQDSSPKNSIDLAAVRAKLAGERNGRLWQSLEEVAGTPQFQHFRDHEFPSKSSKGTEGINRRDVLKLMAASAAMTGLSACTKLPVEKIVPYVKPPEEIVAGRPLFYATSMTRGGETIGVPVESHMGRPTKIEGNPEHPGSLGGTDVFMQASVLTMYDPDRSQAVTYEGRVSTWDDFSAAMANEGTLLSTKGTGLRLLTKTVISPTLGAQIRALLARFP